MTDSPATSGSSDTVPPVGWYRPPRIADVEGRGPGLGLVERLRQVTGLSSAFSDALDEAGLQTAVPAGVLQPMRAGDVRIGRALTLRYLPMRTRSGPSRLAHLTACDRATPGDILVISAPPASTSSVLGGKAAAAAVTAGVTAIVVQGAVRDLDEIDATDLAVWSTLHTPITGRGRLDAVEINGPVEVCGVQCVPGDVVVADRSGVVFVPADRFEGLAAIVLAG
ncbi:MAG TPA: RraA family protein [Candidatus Saccharimonadales bacterium]|nr:RraA family protein [Candidatus Saccharimonadales bacterium]